MKSSIVLRYVGTGVRRYDTHPILPHKRETWEFQFILRGACFPLPEKLPSKSPGPALYIHHPASIHGWGDNTTASATVVVFHFTEAPRLLHERVTPEIPLVVPITKPDANRVRRLGETWKLRLTRPPRLHELHEQMLLLELSLLALERAAAPSTPPPHRDHSKVSRSEAWFRQHVGDNPSVERAALAVGCAPSHLRRLYQNARRPSPKQVLHRIRMDTAAECLRLGWTQKRIADYLGFSELSAFSRAFRQYFRISPGRYLARESLSFLGENQRPAVIGRSLR